MLAKFLCWLLGHDWVFLSFGAAQPKPIATCQRCLEAREAKPVLR
jgi:hypothetical protein